MFAISKNLEPLAKCAARDSTRYAIDAIQLERVKDRVLAVATDGRRLLVVDSPSGADQPDGEKALVPASQWKAASAIHAAQVEQNGKLIILRGAERIELEPLAGHFPKWRDVIPADSPAYSISFDPKLLAETLLAVDAALGKREQRAVRLHFAPIGEDKQKRPVYRPVTIVGVNDGVKVTGVVMPMMV